MSHSSGPSYGLLDPARRCSRPTASADRPCHADPGTDGRRAGRPAAVVPPRHRLGILDRHRCAGIALVEVVPGERFDDYLRSRSRAGHARHLLRGAGSEAARGSRPITAGFSMSWRPRTRPGAHRTKRPPRRLSETDAQALSGGGGLVSSLHDQIALVVKSLLPAAPTCCSARPSRS